jgi:hypothetical protein
MRLVEEGFHAVYIDSDAVVLRPLLDTFSYAWDVQGLSDWLHPELLPTGRPWGLAADVCTAGLRRLPLLLLPLPLLDRLFLACTHTFALCLCPCRRCHRHHQLQLMFQRQRGACASA